MNFSMNLVNFAAAISHAQLKQSASLALAKKTADSQQIQAEGLIEMLESPPCFECKLDIKV